MFSDEDETGAGVLAQLGGQLTLSRNRPGRDRGGRDRAGFGSPAGYSASTIAQAHPPTESQALIGTLSGEV
ncbi:MULTISPECIES: hypothetical protein [unclassified Streptomyces]|uniref:hypothetical protein n=1 Tax=unclassified Streptomyces TaxID=2593676 RepID=UPI001905B44A|nr:hypothetical protein [Streptomyces sp. HSG2]